MLSSRAPTQSVPLEQRQHPSRQVVAVGRGRERAPRIQAPVCGEQSGCSRSSHANHHSRVPGRRCSAITVADVAPAAAMRERSPSTLSSSSLRCGMTGATMTWQGSPASVTAGRGPAGLAGGRPRFEPLVEPLFPMAIETPKPTCTSSAAALSSGRSRFAIVPLVRIETASPTPRGP